MSETISAELFFFLHAALTGILLSVVYDLFRILRRVYTHGCFLIAVEDACYWLGSALYITYVLMKENDGVIRWYFIFGILLGMLLYNLTISRYLVEPLSKFINYILHFVRKILRIVFRPFAFLWKKTRKAGRRGKKFCGKIEKKSQKALKNCYKTIKIGISKK